MIRGQRVRRVVRHIDTWSVLRVAVLFNLSLMLVIVLAGVMLWVAGSVFGAVEGMESFMRGIGFDGFEFVGGQLLRGFTAIGLILVVLGTGATVLGALLYNLIADVVGGVQITVLEEVYVPDPDHAAVVVDAEGSPWLVPDVAPQPLEGLGAGDGRAEDLVPATPATAEAAAAGATAAHDAAGATAEHDARVDAEVVGDVDDAVAGDVDAGAAGERPSVPASASAPNGWTTPAWQPASRAPSGERDSTR